MSRILMLTDFFPPIIGGLERHVDHMSRELVARGHEVAVVTLAGMQPEGRETRNGVRVYRISGLAKALGPLYANAERPFHPTVADPGIVRALRRILRAERPDVVECHSWIMHSYLSMPEAAKLKTIVYLHDYGSFCATKTMVNRGDTCDGPAPAKCVGCSVENYGAVKGLALAAGLRHSRRQYHKVDKWIAGSSFVADTAARALKIPRESIELVPSFVPGTEELSAPFAGRPPRPAFAPEGDYILFVGALGNHKGLDVLLKAFEPLWNHASLLLIGTPQVDTPTVFPVGVHVATNVPHDQVMAAWAHAALGVAPASWPEPFGMVAVEAMATGTPIIASNIGGLRDIVADGETGLLVPPRDVEALRTAMECLLDDPGLRRRLGDSGPVRAREFSLAHAAAKMERIHAALIPRRRAARPARVAAAA